MCRHRGHALPVAGARVAHATAARLGRRNDTSPVRVEHQADPPSLRPLHDVESRT
jgi:hypothetical protein